jgi:protein-S-isoprenylcysteine O-methyltransferase Ste14
VSAKLNEAPDTAGVVAPPPLIYAGALAAGLLLVPLQPPYHAPGRGRRKTRQTTSSLIIEGPYRFTRNPIYLGFTLFYGGITALANSLPSALLLPFVLVMMRRGVIEREERYLERIFGEEYLLYKARVRRWV